MVHADGILAEGTFKADEDGCVELTWQRALEFSGGEWVSKETDSLVASLSLMDGMYGDCSCRCLDLNFITFETLDVATHPVLLTIITRTLTIRVDEVQQVQLDETPESLWGDDKSDPRDALEQNGFQMRQVVLTRKPRGGGGRRSGRGHGGGDNTNE